MSLALHPVAAAEQPVRQWSVDEQPTLVLGQLDGPPEHVFDHVVDATRLSDGTIVVGLGRRGHFEIRYFDPDGGFKTSVGRWGEGPFEHESRWTMERRADSILTVSVGHRFSIFGANGEQLRTGRLDLSQIVNFRGLVEDRYLVLWRERPVDEPLAPSGAAEFLVDLNFHDILTGSTWPAASFPGLQGALSASGLILHLPFQPTAYWDTGAGRLWFGNSGKRVILGRSPTGEEDRVIQLDHPGIPVTSEHREAWRESYPTPSEGPRLREIERYQDRVEYPDSMPFFQDIHVDTEGFVWVLRYQPLHSTTDYIWDVFTPRGERVAITRLPFEVVGPDLRNYARSAVHPIKEIGSDYMLVLLRDELGVERLGQFAILRN